MLAEVIGWEWGYPELGAKHFLTVASYNLQHPDQFTDDAIEQLRAAFIQHLEEDVPVDHIRRMQARRYNGTKRVSKPVSDHHLLRSWPMTIADVYREGRTGSADRVVVWTKTIRPLL